jgi:hypothetical protein
VRRWLVEGLLAAVSCGGQTTTDLAAGVTAGHGGTPGHGGSAFSGGKASGGVLTVSGSGNSIAGSCDCPGGFPTTNSKDCIRASCAPGDCGWKPVGCGEAVDCGPCSPPSICGAVTVGTCCTPTTCLAKGKNCGPTSDGCGNLLDCGTCGSGEHCGKGGPNVCGSDALAACIPLTCADQGILCGRAGDGCGGTITCGFGFCPVPYSRPITCSDVLPCTKAPDGSGGILYCSPCTSD